MNIIVPASDAKIDPIWKAIPGYNGIEVDIGASYEKMKKDGKFNEKKLIFKQVKPLYSFRRTTASTHL